MSDTPKKFPIPQIERAIHESLNPKGMSTHSGKVTLDVSWVQRLLILADHMSELERELAEAKRNYMDLIMAVEKKQPNETRHQTALRYIRERETPSTDAKCLAMKEGGK